MIGITVSHHSKEIADKAIEAIRKILTNQARNIFSVAIIDDQEAKNQKANERKLLKSPAFSIIENTAHGGFTGPPSENFVQFDFNPPHLKPEDVSDKDYYNRLNCFLELKVRLLDCLPDDCCSIFIFHDSATESRTILYRSKEFQRLFDKYFDEV